MEDFKKECDGLGIAIIAPLPHVTQRWTYVGVFPPSRTWETEEEACLAALAHYSAIQSKLPFG